MGGGIVLGAFRVRRYQVSGIDSFIQVHSAPSPPPCLEQAPNHGVFSTKPRNLSRMNKNKAFSGRKKSRAYQFAGKENEMIGFTFLQNFSDNLIVDSENGNTCNFFRKRNIQARHQDVLGNVFPGNTKHVCDIIYVNPASASYDSLQSAFCKAHRTNREINDPTKGAVFSPSGNFNYLRRFVALFMQHVYERFHGSARTGIRKNSYFQFFHDCKNFSAQRKNSARKSNFGKNFFPTLCNVLNAAISLVLDARASTSSPNTRSSRIFSLSFKATNAFPVSKSYLE